eukprot:TRINITY_DN7292_c0_g2_i1.p1 TRINITY_DN7292_c0_g2~~TRINITY_DN7292_c0_g2_i1.p1  ORF type:complete len:805 (-),score=177.23 TRINITY_DN7292_c0_g2_i1:130-2517(-)
MASRNPRMFMPSADVLAAAKPQAGGSRVQRNRFKIPTDSVNTAATSTPSQPSQPSSQAATTASSSQPSQPSTTAFGTLQPQASSVSAQEPAKSPSVPGQATSQSVSEPSVKTQATALDASRNAPDSIIVCFAGELSVDQEEAEDRVKHAGAKVGKGVGVQTSILVMAPRLDDGRPTTDSAKYKQYVNLKAKGKTQLEVIAEEEFLKRFPALPKKLPTPQKAKPAAVPRDAVLPKTANRVKPDQLGSNWVDCYAPRSAGDLIGNPGQMKKLADWLRDWEDVVLRGNTKKVAFRQGQGVPENLNARAALVSGPPGIGKTSTCRMVAQQHGGYDVLEYNASDARGQKVIQEMAEGIADNTTISFGGGKAAQTRRAVIIMDEVDGMGAGDRGGNAALIKMIKKTRNPIICICNDQSSQKVRSLASSCYDLKFAKPATKLMAQRCFEIARRQGFQVELSMVEALAESCGGDMRMVLNQLQMMARSNATLSKPGIQQLGKDQEVMMGPFDACKKLLNTAEAMKYSMKERLEMYFTDHSLVGLLVHENYLRAVERKPVDLRLLHACAYAADFQTVGDMWSERIGSSQEWSLLPYCALASAAAPAFMVNGVLSYTGFPAALGKFSSLSRSRRLAMELQAHLRLSSTVDRKSLMVSPYMELLYKRLIDPLRRAEVKDTVGVLDAYGLQKEHLVEHLTDLRQHLGGEDLFKQVDSKVKAAMTRECNSGSHALKVLLPTKRKRVSENLGEGEEMGEEGEETLAREADDEGSNEEDEGPSDLIKMKGKNSAKAKAKSRANKAPKKKA